MVLADYSSELAQRAYRQVAPDSIYTRTFIPPSTCYKVAIRPKLHTHMASDSVTFKIMHGPTPSL